MWVVTINNEKIGLIERNLIAKGGFAYYFHLKNKGGLKVIQTFHNSKREDCGISSEFKLEKSTIWKKALEEFNYQKLVNTHYEGLSPKAFELVKVFNTDNQKWYPAIFMEHIQGFLLEELMECNELDKEINQLEAYVKDDKILKGEVNNPPKDSVAIEEFIQQKFIKLGFKHVDLHWSNILITPSFRIKIIDYGCIKKCKSSKINNL